MGGEREAILRLPRADQALASSVAAARPAHARLGQHAAALQGLSRPRPDPAAARPRRVLLARARGDRRSRARRGPRRRSTVATLAHLLYFCGRGAAASRVSRRRGLLPRRRLHRRALPHRSLRRVRGPRRISTPASTTFGPHDFALRRLRAGDHRATLVAAAAGEPSVARRPGRARLHEHVLAQRLEVSGARVSPLLLGRRHDPRQPARGRGGAGVAGARRAGFVDADGRIGCSTSIGSARSPSAWSRSASGAPAPPSAPPSTAARSRDAAALARARSSYPRSSPRTPPRRSRRPATSPPRTRRRSRGAVDDGRRRRRSSRSALPRCPSRSRPSSCDAARRGDFRATPIRAAAARDHPPRRQRGRSPPTAR